MEIIIEPRRIRRRHSIPIPPPLELINTQDQPEERLDALRITWTCQQGKVWQLPQIGEQHIRNLVPWMRRRLAGNCPPDHRKRDRAPEHWQLRARLRQPGGTVRSRARDMAPEGPTLTHHYHPLTIPFMSIKNWLRSRRGTQPIPPVQHNAAGYAERQLWNLNKLRQEVAAIGKLEGAGEYAVSFSVNEYLGGTMASLLNGPRFSVYIRLSGGIISPEISIHAPTPELALEQLTLEIRKRKAAEDAAIALEAASMDAQ